MITFLRKPYRWAAAFSIILAVAVTFVMLDTFVIPRAGTPLSLASTTAATAAAAVPVSSPAAPTNAATATDDSVITDFSYQDANIKITIETLRDYDTNIYVADIQLSSIEYLQTAFAQSTYGRNIKETTSDIAENNQAIFAINGDYYGFRDYGFVLRNGILYRGTSLKSGSDEGLAIDSQGNFSIIDESQTDAQALVDSNVWQVLSFGPALIEDGQITVTANSEVSQSMASNPRTAIGQISELHYIFVVSDGRTNDNAGLSLLELSQVLAAKGCTVAYNLDGGGSSTMWFNGQVINSPSNGKSSSERQVSDIVYIGT